MPWFVKPNEYTCDDCKTRFYNREPKPTDRGQAASPVTTTGTAGIKTYCKTCAATHTHGMQGGTASLGKSWSCTITYNIHGQGKTTFLGGAVSSVALASTAALMTASGALGRMSHPNYPGGVIRAPGHWSGVNPGNAALAAWPGAAGMNQHHVHVGGGGDTRVLFGYATGTYPSNPAQLQTITLYIGS
jgi:hypothetical protein